MTVHLVGAGPGDATLITVRGADLLRRAEVVVYDRLTASGLLDLVAPEAELVNVGKDPAGASVPQERINELLVAHGLAGREVVRLKGGDPFVFARGAEEADALEAAGVDYDVVPGVSSAFAVPAAAGIPVTLRYSSANVTVVTGHEDPTKERSDVDWRAVAALGGTIVVLMGVRRWPLIADQLMEAGLDPDTPAAAIHWGATAKQSTLRATLGSLDSGALAAPSVIVVGEVARRRLASLERRALFGRSVVVTRARAQAGRLARLLEQAGARVIEAPTIEVVDPDDAGAGLRAAVSRLREYDWVVLTSTNGVRRFCAELNDGRDLAGVLLAAIGPGTAQELAHHHLAADLVPPRYVAESLLESFPDPPPGGGRVLLARAMVARSVLPEGLAARGWAVDDVDAYRSVPVEPDPTTRDLVRAADAICFTSASTVLNFVDAYGTAAVPPAVITIGPITSDAARTRGLTVASEAVEHTLNGLVSAVRLAVGADPGPTGTPS